MTIIKNIENLKGGNNTEVHRKYLYKMLFITLMKEGGVMAQTIIRNYNNKQLNKGKYDKKILSKI